MEAPDEFDDIAAAEEAAFEAMMEQETRERIFFFFFFFFFFAPHRFSCVALFVSPSLLLQNKRRRELQNLLQCRRRNARLMAWTLQNSL
jgi:hypothetical protein